MRFARFTICALSCLLLAMGCWLAGEAAWTVRAVRKDARTLSKSADGVIARSTALIVDARRVVLSLGGTAADIRKATEEWQRASKAQAKAATDSLERMAALEAQAQTLIANLDANANGPEGLLPVATRAIVETQANLNEQLLPAATQAVASTDNAAIQLQTELAKIGPVLEGMERMTVDAHELMQEAKPGIRSTSEAAESVNIALKPLRKAAGRFVTALKIIGNYLKATIRIY